MPQFIFKSCRVYPGSGLEIITQWASFHHERLGGEGYPFHFRERDLPLGSRIMSVADVFTAITEDRPYRQGMTEAEAIRVLEEMARTSKLDLNIVSILIKNFEKINAIRTTAQATAQKEYKRNIKSTHAHVPASQKTELYMLGESLRKSHFIRIEYLTSEIESVHKLRFS